MPRNQSSSPAATSPPAQNMPRLAASSAATIVGLALTTSADAQLLRDIPEPTISSVGSEVFLQTHGFAPRQSMDDAAIEALLAQMTVAEKIGQMTQLDIFMVTDFMDSDLRRVITPSAEHCPSRRQSRITDCGYGPTDGCTARRGDYYRGITNPHTRWRRYR